MSHHRRHLRSPPHLQAPSDMLKHTDRGRVYLSRRNKAVVVIEGSPAAFCVATYEGLPEEKAAQATGRFSLKATLEAAPSGHLDGQALYLVFDLQKAGDVTGACDFCALNLNCSTREYRVESYGAGGNLRVLQTAANVAALRPNEPVSVRLMFHADVISVEINEAIVTDSLHVGRWPALPVECAYTRGVGVAVYGRTRALVSKFSLTSECPTLRVARPSLSLGSDELTARSLATVERTADCSFASTRLVEEEGPRRDAEETELAAMLERDILREPLQVSFDDVAGLSDAKRLLKEAVILPSLLPELFRGVREPWRGFLLFGPPGTGKTLLAKAVASATQWTFFACSLATLTSKWRGESEKLIRALFQTARARGPTVLFFDEIDALMARRGSASEHEASRRAKSELLIQLDGLTAAAVRRNRAGEEPETDTGGEGLAPDHILVLATSNTPWDIDDALRRRLEKRIYVPLPDRAAREHLLRIHVGDISSAEDLDLSTVADRTENFSGADLQHLCREACMNPIRRVFADLSLDEIREKRATGAFDKDAVQVTMADFEQALQKARPSINAAEIKKYEAWDAAFGNR
ncbi:katanin-like family protein [Besnoitia besnoiti]|uniref:Katanin-like family protein n=1 Tax=Besnoitia besnoiti TaxID=94643 RepID=A0A2A9MBB2_BESBE|nr:katanin-like family protein [Besnoitia besnoiti]PFH32907.1 katanin-like family protein [Besnoitia besnoiti]